MGSPRQTGLTRLCRALPLHLILFPTPTPLLLPSASSPPACLPGSCVLPRCRSRSPLPPLSSQRRAGCRRTSPCSQVGSVMACCLCARKPITVFIGPSWPAISGNHLDALPCCYPELSQRPDPLLLTLPVSSRCSKGGTVSMSCGTNRSLSSVPKKRKYNSN